MCKRVFNHTLHKELWNWLSENPTKTKFDWPKWKKLRKKPIPTNYCFACEAASCKSCENCPLDWGDRCSCISLNSPYNKYMAAQKYRDYTLASAYAKQVAELPLREGIENDILIV